MTMSSHVGKVCSKAFRRLYNIRHIRKFLSEDSTKTLIHAFVTCYSLLYGIPKYQLDRLQRVLNAAPRLTCYVPRFNHITPTLHLRSVLQNPDRKRTNHSTGICLRLVLPYNKCFYSINANEIPFQLSHKNDTFTFKKITVNMVTK